MKKLFLLSVLSLLWSASIYAQTSCPDDNVTIDVISVEWNATQITPLFPNETLNEHSSVQGLQEFHLINIQFSGGHGLFADGATQSIDLNLYKYGIPDDLPVVIRFRKFVPNARVRERYYRGKLIGFDFDPLSGFSMGVASGAAVTALNAPPTGGPGLAADGIQIVRENKLISYIDGANCTAPNPISSWVFISPTFGFGKEAQATNENTDVSVYPNPARHTLFVKKTSSNNADLQDIEVFNLFGQQMTHKINVRYGQDELQITTAQLDPGIYMLNISTSSGEKILRKITVQH